jgi:hypothetical protein
VALTFPDEVTKRIFFGDIPHKVCNWTGYPSITNVFGGQVEHKPYCFWLDGNNSYEPKPKSVSFHMDDITGDNITIAAYTNNADLICNSAARMNRYYMEDPDDIPFFYPILEYGRARDNRGNRSDYLDPKRILNSEQEFWPETWGRDSGEGGGVVKPKDFKHFNMSKYDLSNVGLDDIDNPQRRDLLADHHRRKFKGQYVVSNRTEWAYTATAICGNAAAWGPHWASTNERMFCNMADRTLWEFCPSPSIMAPLGCFDAITGTLYARGYDNVHALAPSLPQPVLQLDHRIDF